MNARIAKEKAERKYGVKIQEQAPLESTRESERLHLRAQRLRDAAATLLKRINPNTMSYGEWGEVQTQAKACRYEAGVLIRRARALAKRGA